MRHRNGISQAQPPSSHRQGYAAQHGKLPLRHESHQDHRAGSAGELRKVVEPLITRQKPSLAKSPVWPSIVSAIVTSSSRFSTKLGPRFSTRNGGYLRILKCGFRDGDNAPMCFRRAA